MNTDQSNVLYMHSLYCLCCQKEWDLLCVKLIHNKTEQATKWESQTGSQREREHEQVVCVSVCVRGGEMCVD